MDCEEVRAISLKRKCIGCKLCGLRTLKGLEVYKFRSTHSRTVIDLIHYILDVVIYPIDPLMLPNKLSFPPFPLLVPERLQVIKNHKNLHLILWEKLAGVI